MSYLLDCMHTPSEDLRDYRALLYAESGTGKTTFAAEAGMLIVDFEGGTRAMACQAIDLTSRLDPNPERKKEAPHAWRAAGIWARFRMVVEDLSELAGNDLLPIRGLAIDTIDAAYDAAMACVFEAHGWKEIDDAGPFGRGYTVVLDELKRSVGMLDELGVGLFFLAHAKEREFKARGQVPYSKIVPAMPPSACRWLLGACDLVLYGEVALDTDGRELRVLHSQPSHRFDAKARGRRDHPLPSPLPLDYNTFAVSFEAAMRGEAKASPITLAAADPVEAPTTTGSNPWAD
jgi:hypothetical protein